MSDLNDAMVIAAKGMKAQGTRMKVISENIANSSTTGKTPGEEPYRRQLVTFKNIMNRKEDLTHVKVDKIVTDNSAFTLKYDPSQPAADESGYVKQPNVNTLVEMMDMKEAQRSYEANLGMIEISRSMLMRSVDLLRQ